MSPGETLRSSAIPVVLVVDDDALARAMLSEALEGIECRVVTATSADEALAILERQKVQVVIADHYMDGMTGLALLVLLHDRNASPKRILLTGHLDKDMALKAINRAEVFRVIEKPFDRLTVRIAILQALNLPVRVG